MSSYVFAVCVILIFSFPSRLPVPVLLYTARHLRSRVSHRQLKQGALCAVVAAVIVNKITIGC